MLENRRMSDAYFDARIANDHDPELTARDEHFVAREARRVMDTVGYRKETEMHFRRVMEWIEHQGKVTGAFNLDLLMNQFQDRKGIYDE